MLDPIGNQFVESGEELRLLLTAMDPDDDNLHCEVANLPTGATLTDHQDGTAEFLWTPAVTTTGNYMLTFKVIDDGLPAESDSETITITVGVNRSP